MRKTRIKPNFFLLQPTAAHIYLTIFSLYIMFNPTCFDNSVSPSGILKNLSIAKLPKFLKLNG